MSRRVPTLCSVHLRRCRTGQSTRRREGDGVVRGRRLQVAANERAELNLPRVMPSGSAIIIVTHAHLMPNPRSIRLARSVLTDLGGDPGRLTPDRNSGANARRRHCSPGLHDLSLEKEPPGGKESGYHTGGIRCVPTLSTLRWYKHSPRNSYSARKYPQHARRKRRKVAAPGQSSASCRSSSGCSSECQRGRPVAMRWRSVWNSAAWIPGRSMR